MSRHMANGLFGASAGDADFLPQPVDRFPGVPSQEASSYTRLDD